MTKFSTQSRPLHLRVYSTENCNYECNEFGLFDGNVIIGVAIFGQVIGRNQAAFWFPENPAGLVELRRLACVDDTPKNTESYFIGQCLKILKRETSLDAVISLADKNYGHEGVIYRASNFEFLGETPKDGHPRLMIDGIDTHPKTLYNRHGSSSVPLLKGIYGNRLQTVAKVPKNVYLYRLRKRKNFVHKVQQTVL